MSEKITAEDILHNIAETLSDHGQKSKSVSFFGEDKSSLVPSQIKRLFGRQKPVHHLFGGGKAADVLLWRNKKISASVLTSATIIWVLFEWLNYHFLTLVCFALVLWMLAQFIWTNASGFLNRSSSSNVPRIVLPEDLFVNIAVSLGAEVNRALGYLQDIACEGNLKHFLLAVVSLWAGAVISSWCSLITVVYIGFVAAHTLPILYEKYDEEIDAFAYKVLDQLRGHYDKLDSSLLSKIPKGQFKGKKFE